MPAVQIHASKTRVTSPLAPATRPFGYLVVLGWLGFHLLVGVGGALLPLVGTAHAAAATIVILWLFIFSRRVDRVVAAMAYGGMCDVYWRMTESRAPWEYSKYLVVLGAVVILVRFVPQIVRAGAPVAFVALLVPGMLTATLLLGVVPARGAISGTEMGLLAFAFAALALRQLVASTTDMWNLGWVLLGPLVAVLAVTSHALLTNPDIEFGTEASFAATGGFGPNQVSSALGLMMLICVLLALIPGTARFWPVLGALGAWSAWAGFLTFSRGGIYSMLIAGGAMLLVGIGTRGSRSRSIVMLVVATFALFVVFSSANDFSGNWLDTRYEEGGTTGRTNIAAMDLEVFGSHPLTGVGTGQSRYHRPGEGRLATASAHTEFTRVLAEHGILGLAALGVMTAMVVQGYRLALTRWNQLMVVAFAAWSLTTMLHAATRIGGVAVMLALTQLRVEDAPPAAGSPPQSAAERVPRLTRRRPALPA